MVKRKRKSKPKHDSYTFVQSWRCLNCKEKGEGAGFVQAWAHRKKTKHTVVVKQDAEYQYGK